jgi:hypothetical protein
MKKVKDKSSRGEFSYNNRKFPNKKKPILDTNPIKESKENIPLGEFSDKTDKDIKKMLNSWYRPEWLPAVELLVRKGQKLQAVKLFKEKEDLSILRAKDTIETHIETGNWQHYLFLRRGRLDQAFINVTGCTIEKFKKEYHLNKEEADRTYADANQPLFTIDTVLAVAHEYVNVIRKDSQY